MVVISQIFTALRMEPQKQAGKWLARSSGVFLIRAVLQDHAFWQPW